MGDHVLLRTKELLDDAEIGKFRPRWEGPLHVRAIAGPNTCTLAPPKRFECSPTVTRNVELLKTYCYHTDSDRRSSLGSETDPGQEGEYEVEQILKRYSIS